MGVHRLGWRLGRRTRRQNEFDPGTRGIGVELALRAAFYENCMSV